MLRRFGVVKKDRIDELLDREIADLRAGRSHVELDEDRDVGKSQQELDERRRAYEEALKQNLIDEPEIDISARAYLRLERVARSSESVSDVIARLTSRASQVTGAAKKQKGIRKTRPHSAAA